MARSSAWKLLETIRNKGSKLNVTGKWGYWTNRCKCVVCQRTGNTLGYYPTEIKFLRSQRLIKNVGTHSYALTQRGRAALLNGKIKIMQTPWELVRANRGPVDQDKVEQLIERAVSLLGLKTKTVWVDDPLVLATYVDTKIHELLMTGTNYRNQWAWFEQAGRLDNLLPQPRHRLTKGHRWSHLTLNSLLNNRGEAGEAIAYLLANADVRITKNRVYVCTSLPTRFETIAPTSINVFHSIDGPAFEWGNYKGYYLNGEEVPSAVITRQGLTRDIVTRYAISHRNAELRRNALRAMGGDALKYLATSTIDSDVDQHGRHRKLIETNVRVGNRNMRVRAVHVVCPSTQSEYYLTVPTFVRTSQEAVAWTFGFTGKKTGEWRPAHES